MRFRINLTRFLDVLLYVFCFVLVVDPPNIIFKIKNIIFVVIIALLVLLYHKVSSNKLYLFLIVYFLLVITLLRGIIAGYNFDFEYTKIYFKAFSPLLLLLWINKIELFDKLIFPSICICIISLLIVYSMFYLPEIEGIVYAFMQDHDDFVIMSNRYFLGIRFVNVFYRTIPLVIIPCSVYCYKMLFEQKNRKRNFIIFIIFTLALFFSGTRANILSVLFIAISFIIMRFRVGKAGLVISYALMFVFCILSFFVLMIFLSEKTESSNAVKFGHLSSYIDLFNNNVDILLFGQGIGSLFYSSGFREFVAQTEWSYIEIIRYVGLLGGIFIIGVFVYPLYLLYKDRKDINYSLAFGIGYSFYLGIAGTNPLLTSSTGMLALLIAYSYVLSPFHRKHMLN